MSHKNLCTFILGRAVFTTRSFQKGKFLLQYPGELITGNEGERRDDAADPNGKIFRYYFKYNNKILW